MQLTGKGSEHTVLLASRYQSTGKSIYWPHGAVAACRFGWDGKVYLLGAQRCSEQNCPLDTMKTVKRFLEYFVWDL